jgi:hypothetical protein
MHRRKKKDEPTEASIVLDLNKPAVEGNSSGLL